MPRLPSWLASIRPVGPALTIRTSVSIGTLLLPREVRRRRPYSRAARPAPQKVSASYARSYPRPVSEAQRHIAIALVGHEDDERVARDREFGDERSRVDMFGSEVLSADEELDARLLEAGQRFQVRIAHAELRLVGGVVEDAAHGGAVEDDRELGVRDGDAGNSERVEL